MAKDLFDLDADYNQFLIDLKQRIQSAQVKAALAVNRELVLLYWQVGKEILGRQQRSGWGSKVVSRLAQDLKQAFPDIKGFSRTNLLYMRAFAEAYPEELIVQGVLGQIPWYHNLALLDKLNSQEERLWYAQKALENGWSRNVLVLQIDDQPTIGIILCKSQDRTVAEYSLQDVNKPIGVSTHRLGRELPEPLQNSLPTIEQLEMEMSTVSLDQEKEDDLKP